MHFYILHTFKISYKCIQMYSIGEKFYSNIFEI